MNVELATAALEDAKANPDRFDMALYWGNLRGFTKDSPDMTVPPCGTTGCFAGFAALRAAPVGTRVIPGDVYHSSRIIHPGQDADDAPDTEEYARKALEITGAQAGVLFHLDTIGQVERAVRYLADNPDTSDERLWDVAY